MMTVQVSFVCESCGRKQEASVPMGTAFALGSDSVPEGWKVDASGPRVRCWCPQHVRLSR